jgi:hypothetical protein
MQEVGVVVVELAVLAGHEGLEVVEGVAYSYLICNNEQCKHHQ